MFHNNEALWVLETTIDEKMAAAREQAKKLAGQKVLSQWSSLLEKVFGVYGWG